MLINTKLCTTDETLLHLVFWKILLIEIELRILSSSTLCIML